LEKQGARQVFSGSAVRKRPQRYDFTNPKCRKTPEIPPERFPEQFDPDIHTYSQYIQRPEWKAAVDENRNAIGRSDLIILLLPCGNDAHADWALGVGMGKRSIVAGHPNKGDRSPVHMWADAILDSPDDVAGYIDCNFPEYTGTGDL